MRRSGAVWTLCRADRRRGARRRSTIRLSADDIASGLALACQTVIEGDVTVTIPEQEKIERRLVTDKAVARAGLPFPFSSEMQAVHALRLQMDEPNLQDNRDDLTRLRLALADAGFPRFRSLWACCAAWETRCAAPNGRRGLSWRPIPGFVPRVRHV